MGMALERCARARDPGRAAGALALCLLVLTMAACSTTGGIIQGGADANDRDVDTSGEQTADITAPRAPPVPERMRPGTARRLLDLLDLPDPQPRPEPLHAVANQPYVLNGRRYVPMRALAPYQRRGTASWYGPGFHGRRTATGEVYDMYRMTAAHPTLPLPSYARVTDVRTGKRVVVRVNDRGPFRNSREIDLSYTAALKLGTLAVGLAEVEVELITFPRRGLD